jgi:aminoglycoside N3'-acetyltransferase
VALAGAGITHLTLFHHAEELLEQKMPFSPFTQETYTMRFRADGEVLETAPMRLYAPEVSRRRALRPIETALRSAGQWRETKVGTLTLAAIRARDVLQTVDNMAARGVFCYDSDESR